MGAWIETHILDVPNTDLVQSHPMWVRGLKLQDGEKVSEVDRVAPYVGAWIETQMCNLVLCRMLVAPYVGAWIETLSTNLFTRTQPVAPYVGAWIETSNVKAYNFDDLSHPMWVRGLKLRNYTTSRLNS